jgi:hypothetical protein
MKNFKLKKLVAVALTVMTIATVLPIGASAAWKQDSKGWWNTEGKSWSVGWRSINGSWYNFGSDGYMKTGWVNDGGKWYFQAPSGEMKTGWVNDGGKWYFTAPSGEMKTGWVNDGGTWYYTVASGEMKTGWINVGGTWYFTAASGAMETGVIEVDGKVYYLSPSGAMVTGAVTIDGVTYTFAASGEAVGDKIPTPTVAFTSTGISVTPSKPTDTSTSSSGGGSSHHSSGTSYVALSQTVIDAQYQAVTKMTNPETCSTDNADGTTTIKPKFGFTPGKYTEYIAATGKSYTVTKDVYVTLDGTDAFISGNYTNGYTIEAGATGTVKITVSISVYDSTNAKLYYVTTTPKAIVLS